MRGAVPDNALFKRFELITHIIRLNTVYSSLPIRRFVATILLCMVIHTVIADDFFKGVHRVVFLGDSITHGGQYVSDVELFSIARFPQQKIEFLNLGLPSETVSGLSEAGHAGGAFPRPDLDERLDRVLALTKPDLVIASYGMNDGIYFPFNKKRFARFKEGITRLHKKVIKSGAKIIHLTPSPFDSLPLKGRALPAGLDSYPQPFEGYDGVLNQYSEWLLARRSKGWEVVDIHGAINAYLAEHRKTNSNLTFAGDGIHINDHGNWLVAREILKYVGAPTGIRQFDDVNAFLATVTNGEEIYPLIQKRQALLKDSLLATAGHRRPGMGKGLPLAEARQQASVIGERLQTLALPFPGKRAQWNGYDRYDYEVDGKPVQVVVPRESVSAKPWVWHGEFFGHKPEPEIALLEKGFHVVYMSLPDMLGSPEAVQHWNAFYEDLTQKRGLGKKAALVGLSRGGLYCYNWASANPEKVSCIYADAPVCDFKSWPGGKGKGKGSPGDWQLVLKRYGFKNEAEALAYDKNPVDNLAPLAAAHVPLLHVYGDADDVVPWEENTGLIAKRYRKLGGSITLIAKPGVGHHPHGLEDSAPIVDFILKAAAQ